MKVKVKKTLMGGVPVSGDINYTVSDDDGSENQLICVFPDMEYQTVKGFGGAFTEAAASTLTKLSAKNREKVLRSYFSSEDGIGYTLGRVHINSCDFCIGNYACIPDGDTTIEGFNIERDKQYIIPVIKAAMSYNGNISLLASPWSPPAHMKTNGNMNRGGKLKGEYSELWAECYVRFIKAYRDEGISIRAVTVQNEPNAVQPWDSCVYTAEEERDFVKHFLGERMEKLGVRILFWDHNKERTLSRARVMLNDADAAKYVSGIGVHWYSGDHFEQLDMFNRLYPDKDIIFTEGCRTSYKYGQSDTSGTGEMYAHDIIGNFNNGCSAFLDWNLLLDEHGGPNHVGNFCYAPIMADTVNDRVIVHDSYYYIGHFSKYVMPGAKRIGSSRYTDAIETVSFKNPDGSVVTVLLNRTEQAKPAVISVSGKLIKTELEPHSIATYVFEL